jgi:DtxR family Mn-dependent transcriptional regulator
VNLNIYGYFIMVCTKKDRGTPAPLSESMQMYLVSIARLRVDDQLVPLSSLARELSVSPASVNEMCRKLQDQGQVVYQPYKGVSLTPDGERRAYYVLRRHRLWEVFLVQKLGLGYDEAHEAACQLEHATSDLVTNRLDAFLGYPPVNPQGEPVPRANGIMPARSVIPMAALSVGQRGQVVRCDVGDAAQAFMHERGLRPGVTVTVLAIGGDSLLVQVEGTQTSLARTLAESVQVEPEDAQSEAVPDVPRMSLDPRPVEG